MTVSEAKIKVLNKNPFFGSILFALPVIEEPAVGTLGVDGEVLYYNPEFWNKLSRAKQYGILMHEAGHLFLKHLWRGRNYKEIAADPTTGQVVSIFNIAGDHVINNMIAEDSRFALPQPCCQDPKYKGWATEAVYHDLVKNMPKMTEKQMQDFVKKFGGGGDSWCSKKHWNKGQGEKQLKQQEEKWNNVIKQAVQYSRERGYEPAWMKRLYDELQPKEDWRNILREYIQPFSNDYTFNPVDRRYLESDFSLPDICDGEKLDWIAVGIDTSGSIQGAELNAFIGELKSILSAYDQVKCKLTFCDAEATPFVELKDFETDKGNIKVAGGGGTDFVPVFKMVAKEDTPPLCLLYFTDGYGNFPQRAPDYDTMWITTTGDAVKFPWGKVLKYKL